MLAVSPAHADPSEVSLLTYNIHGLPGWIARDDPPARIPKILAQAKAYDVVLLQEDFAYHDAVIAHSPFAVLVRGNEPWARGPLLEGAGLTILSRFASVASQREAYGVCNGWIAAANDCLGNKGFLMARIALPNGALLDVWNTHLDAGDGDADRAARAAQLERLAAAMETQSAGRPLVVGGDFNLEWDEPRDRALLERFAARLGLHVAAQTPPDGWDSHLDSLWIRGVQRADGGKDGRFVQADGEPLSDHPAIFARVRARKSISPEAQPASEARSEP